MSKSYIRAVLVLIRSLKSALIPLKRESDMKVSAWAHKFLESLEQAEKEAKQLLEGDKSD